MLTLEERFKFTQNAGATWQIEEQDNKIIVKNASGLIGVFTFEFDKKILLNLEIFKRCLLLHYNNKFIMEIEKCKHLSLDKLTTISTKDDELKELNEVTKEIDNLALVLKTLRTSNFGEAALWFIVSMSVASNKDFITKFHDVKKSLIDQYKQSTLSEKQLELNIIIMLAQECDKIMKRTTIHQDLYPHPYKTSDRQFTVLVKDENERMSIDTLIQTCKNLSSSKLKPKLC